MTYVKTAIPRKNRWEIVTYGCLQEVRKAFWSFHIEKIEWRQDIKRLGRKLTAICPIEFDLLLRMESCHHLRTGPMWNRKKNMMTTTKSTQSLPTLFDHTTNPQSNLHFQWWSLWGTKLNSVAYLENFITKLLKMLMNLLNFRSP